MQLVIILILKTCVLWCAANEYKIAWLAPTETYGGWIDVYSSIGGFTLALDTIAAQEILADNFTLMWRDVICDEKGGIASIYDVLITDNFQPHLVVGPPCSEAMSHAGELAGFRGLSIFSWMSDSAFLQDKVTYNSLVRSYGPVNEIADSVVLFLNYMTWNVVELISTASYYSHGQGVYDAISSSDSIRLVRWVDSALDVETESNIRSYFNTLKKEARIVILALPLTELRKWMIAAHDSGMSGGDYVFIYLYNEIPSLAFKVSVLETQFYNYGDNRDPDALIAYESLFVLTQNVDYVDDFVTFDEEARNSATAERLEELNLSGIFVNFTDQAAPFLHDAVLLWAVLMNESKAMGLDDSQINGSFLLEKAKNRIFNEGYWATGNMYLDENGDRQPTFWILDLGDDKIFRAAMETVIQVSPDNGFLQSSYVEVVDIIWGDGSQGFSNRPISTPKCGFQGEKCPDYILYIVPPAVFLVLVAIAVSVFLAIRKYQYEQGLTEMSWKIDEEDLIMKKENKYRGSMLLSISRAYSVGKSTANSSIDGASASSILGQTFIQLATYKKNTVAVKKIFKNKLKYDRALLLEMQQMVELKHPNLATFFGATVKTPELLEIWQYCAKGSVYEKAALFKDKKWNMVAAPDILFNDSITLDTMFNFSITLDIFRGLKYLHKSPLKLHGNLTSSNCVVDSRWVCKLTDFGLTHFHSQQQDHQDLSEHQFYTKLFWTSPEQLRSMSRTNMREKAKGSPEADVFAAAVIVKEIFSRNGPYSEVEEKYSPKDIIEKVTLCHNQQEPFRPDLKEVKVNSHCQTAFINLIEAGWNEQPEQRPTAGDMLAKLKKINPSKSSKVMDNIIELLETYSNNLEGLVQERAKQVEEEKRRSEKLLYQMLPRSVAESLKKGLQVPPEAYDAVSIYFSDIVSFTSLAAQSTPMQVIQFLNKLYTEFDAITSAHNVYKVETIGDAYMYVSGLPQRNGNEHANQTTRCAIDLLHAVRSFKVQHIDNYTLKIRIGIHTGPVVAGVVGLTMPRYCLFGDTVTVASMMESSGHPMEIQLTQNTFKFLSKENNDFIITETGNLDYKGEKMVTYFIANKE